MLGEALGWKFNHESGMCTRANKITKWPKSLGKEPTEAEQAIIIQEYQDYLAANPIPTRADKIALIDSATTLAEVKEIIKGLI